MNLIQWFNKLIKKEVRQSSPYHDLAPVDDISEKSEYFVALDWALENEKIYNVAISAPFGAGKSSVIESYLKARKTKALQLSLANFNKLENIDSDEIEREFLKKLFYKAKYKDIPQSRYRKLHRISHWKVFGYLVTVILLIISFVIAFNPRVVLMSLKTLEETRKNLCLPRIVGGALFSGIVFASIYLVSWGLKWTFSKWKNMEILVFDKAKFSTNGEKADSIFNRYLDEIVYFFEETDYRVVFIEDLDRFANNSIFSKLRELNILLNRYDAVKRHITFVYAIRDDYFPNDTDRTKFFDFIIPVIPYINVTNSDDLLRRRIKEIRASGIDVRISDEYISQVSTYIGDMRVLTSLINEFVTYKKVIVKDESRGLSDEELMSLMVFKNLFPKDFADIESEKGIIKDTFCCKDRFIAEKVEKLENEMKEEEENIDRCDQDVLKSLKEIKQVFLQSLVPNLRVKAIYDQGNKRFTYDQIMDDEFDFVEFENDKLWVEYLAPSGGVEKKRFVDFGDIYTGNIDGYIDRWKSIAACRGEKREEIKKHINETREEVYKLRIQRMQDLIGEYGAEEVFSFKPQVLQNHLLVFMLRNGYIDENYGNYINNFYPDSITLNEHAFLLNVRNHGGVKEFNYEIIHPERVSERLLNHEFRQVEVLNFSLTEYLIKDKLISEKAVELFRLLASRRKETTEFIIQYFQNEPDTLPVFIGNLAEYNPYLWEDIVNDDTILDKTKTHYFDLLIKYASIDAIKRMELVNNCISSFMVERKTILSDMKECRYGVINHVIDALGLKFVGVSFDGVDERIQAHIYKMNSYEINTNMIGEIIRHLAPEYYEAAARMNYTILKKLNADGLKQYVDENIEQYIENIVLSETNCEETQEAIEELMELVGYNVDTSMKIIDAQKTVFTSLTTLVDAITDENKEFVHKICDYLIEANKLEMKWNSIMEYYSSFGLTPIIFSQVVQNIDGLCEEKYDLDERLTDELITQDWPIEKFILFVEHYPLNELDLETSDLDEEKVKVLISLSYFPYSNRNFNFVINSFPSLIVPFFERYKSKILENLDRIPVQSIPYDGIMVSNEYNELEKIRIIEKCDSTKITRGIAEFISHYKGNIGSDYIKASVVLLTKKDKYELLINHLDNLENKDLPTIFLQLDQEYMELANRTNHKVVLEKNEYNEKLLIALKKKDYLTSVKLKERTDGKKNSLFLIEPKEVFVCRVKEQKRHTKVLN